jgi:hypothetical protein
MKEQYPPQSQTEPICFFIETLEVAFTWIGSETKPSGSGKVWLTTSGGDPVLEVSAASTNSKFLMANEEYCGYAKTSTKAVAALNSRVRQKEL